MLRHTMSAVMLASLALPAHHHHAFTVWARRFISEIYQHLHTLIECQTLKVEMILNYISSAILLPC